MLILEQFIRSATIDLYRLYFAITEVRAVTWQLEILRWSRNRMCGSEGCRKWEMDRVQLRKRGWVVTKWVMGSWRWQLASLVNKKRKELLTI